MLNPLTNNALLWPIKSSVYYNTVTADFADSAIDRGHSHRGRLSFRQSPSLPSVLVRDNRVE